MSTDTYQVRHRSALIARSPPPKTTMCAIVLLLFGTIFLVFGMVIFFESLWNDSRDRGISLMAVGSIMFIPGSYASVIVYGSYMGWSGYDYNQIPSYDEY
jgi:hypothetical protein